jgi:hypothetical protein
MLASKVYAKLTKMEDLMEAQSLALLAIFIIVRKNLFSTNTLAF